MKKFNEMMESVRVFQFATVGTKKEKISVEEFRQAWAIVQDLDKLHRYQDELLTLENSEESYNKPITAETQRKAESLENKLAEQVKKYGYRFAYYSHRFTLETEDKKTVYLD